MRARQTHEKRRKEQARQERQKEKAERRAQRKAARADGSLIDDDGVEDQAPIVQVEQDSL